MKDSNVIFQEVEMYCKDYVKEVRKLVGNFPLKLDGTGLILKKGDKFLLQVRSDNNKIGLLGGGREVFETYEETMIRELKEEAGIVVEDESILKLFGCYAGRKHITIHPNGHIVLHSVTVFEVNGELLDQQQVEEISNFRNNETIQLLWLTIKEIENAIHEDKVFPNNIPILEDVVKKYK